jgi:hypothetical protein
MLLGYIRIRLSSLGKHARLAHLAADFGGFLLKPIRGLLRLA